MAVATAPAEEATYAQQPLAGIPDGQEWRAKAREGLMSQWTAARRELRAAEGELEGAKGTKKRAEAALDRVEQNMEHVQTCRLPGCVKCEELGRNTGALPKAEATSAAARSWEADPLADLAPFCPTCDEIGETFVPCGLFHGDSLERCTVLARTVCLNGHEFSSLHGRLGALATVEEFGSTRWEPSDGMDEELYCSEGHPATAARFDVTTQSDGRQRLQVRYRCAKGDIWEPQAEQAADDVAEQAEPAQDLDQVETAEPEASEGPAVVDEANYGAWRVCDPSGVLPTCPEDGSAAVAQRWTVAQAGYLRGQYRDAHGHTWDVRHAQ